MTQETVSAMIERGAKIRWECEVSPLAHCGATDLNAIARAKGGDFTLANRRPACRIPGCPGRIRFMDKSYVWPRQVDTIDERYAAWWDYSAAEKERLYALGWWLEMGKWQPPPAPVYGRGPDSKTPPARPRASMRSGLQRPTGSTSRPLAEEL